MPEYLHIIRQFSLCPLFLLIMFAFSYIISNEQKNGIICQLRVRSIEYEYNIKLKSQQSKHYLNLNWRQTGNGFISPGSKKLSQDEWIKYKDKQREDIGAFPEAWT